MQIIKQEIRHNIKTTLLRHVAAGQDHLATVVGVSTQFNSFLRVGFRGINVYNRAIQKLLENRRCYTVPEVCGTLLHESFNFAQLQI